MFFFLVFLGIWAFVGSSFYSQDQTGLTVEPIETLIFFSIALPKELAREEWVIIDNGVPKDTLAFIYLPIDNKKDQTQHSSSLMVGLGR